MTAKKLMTHLYYGDPSLDFSHELAKTLASAGADGVIVGTAQAELYNRYLDSGKDVIDSLPEISGYIKGLKEVCNNVEVYSSR